MKPQLLKVSMNLTQSFSARQDTVPYINNRWHYHPEVELIYFKKGNGTQFIGDSIQRFRSGDLVLIGAHLPHYWRFDDEYFEENGNTSADVRVIHFCENFWGQDFLELPENKLIKMTLEKARRGIQIGDKIKAGVGDILNQIIHTTGPRKIILLIEALMIIGNCNKQDLLSSIGFRHDFEAAENERINNIYNYSISNFKRKIQLADVAEIAKVSPNSFCRYFKSRTGKTYSQFINEIRVGTACKLLIENRISVKEICYQSGFHNFASFHKYFKEITGKSPLNYQKEYFIKTN